MAAKLLLKHEGLTLSSYDINKKQLAIGRTAENDIQLDDPAVSSNHARLSLKPNEYLENYYDVYLEDLGSTNGTIVNDAKIIKQLLKHGDIIRIGSHQFTFDSGEKEHFESTAIYLPDNE
jgi:pSer/pThr/pTyr-binding forkhead associated (FHA) protein